MRLVVVVMTGIGFSFGLLIGIFLHLPANSLPADDNFVGTKLNFRHVRSLSGLETPQGQYTLGDERGRNGDNAVSETIRIQSPDQVIGLGSIVHSANNMGRKDDAFLDVKENHSSRNSDRVKLNIGEGKHNPNSVHSKEESEEDEVPRGGIDTGASRGEKRPVSLTVVVKSNSKVAAVIEDSSRKSTKAKSAGSSDQVEGLASMTSGIHWVRELESACPGGYTKTDSDSWRIKTRSAHIVKLEDGCGRMQNRLVTFDDASKACVRYRLNTDQIQGEIYSYYLARLLNMTNLPPSVLHKVDRVSDYWKNVHLGISDSQWADGKIVVFTRFIDGLSPGYIPEPLRENSRRVHPTEDLWRGKPLGEMCDLMQWSDLIVFDYLTANLDRMVNNMFNRQWNEQMMNNPAHNLERTPNGKLIFLDNESGLFHGYRLLDKYADYHSTLLKSLCVFRRSTTEAVKRLYHNDNIGDELNRVFLEGEVLHSSLPQIPRKNIKVLKQRLKDVYNQISECEMQYGR